jgi:translocator assembly and maintenance protein 41
MQGDDTAELYAELQQLVGAFPPVRYAFGYGSGVVPQSNVATDNSVLQERMKDLILVVDDEAAWHKANLAMNRDHYSALRIFGSKFLAFVQNLAAGVYFNTHVQVRSQKVKYGVISTHRLLKDLREWDSFYISGRMQKPVVVVRDDEEVAAANEENLCNALRLALLSLPHKFERHRLWLTLTSLSYTGDFRMRFGENKNKIQNIVTESNMRAFERLYANSLHRLSTQLTYLQDQQTFQQDMSGESQARLVGALPVSIRGGVSARIPATSWPGVPRQQLATAAFASLEAIVRRSSRRQTLKGVLTAGMSKSMLYAAQKLAKMRTRAHHSPARNFVTCVQK